MRLLLAVLLIVGVLGAIYAIGRPAVLPPPAAAPSSSSVRGNTSPAAGQPSSEEHCMRAGGLPACVFLEVEP